MFLGTVDDWTAEGTVVSWYPTAASYASASLAARHPAPVSYQQSQHLQYYRRQTSLGRDIPRLCIGVWEIMGVCDVEAMTQAINTHVRRHDTYHDWFTFGENDEIHRYVIDEPEAITLAPTDHGMMTPPQIRKLLLDTPDPLQWDCFTFGIIQGEDRFTVYIAIDHLRADGMSAGVIFLDIQTAYFTSLQSAAPVLTPAASHRDFCTTQRTFTAGLDEQSPQIQSWREFVAANGGALPAFPLELGEATPDTPGAIDVFDLIDEDQGQRFEAACRAAGARFSGGVFACAALTEHRLTGATTYFGLTPFDNRRDPAFATTVGWLASFVPLAIPTAGAPFAEVVTSAQSSFDLNTTLGAVPYYHLLEMPEPVSGSLEVPDRPVPMLSYIDIRKLPFSDYWDGLRIGIWGDNRLSEAVCMWVNRMRDKTQLVVAYPGTDVARKSILRYAEAMRAEFTRVADSVEQFTYA
ncbi:non-ribosomal peptide synthase [Mycobacterium sp. JS623]|uniref:condensation domain-containing protein n=1 Tax=Mycobacterium sp. JS623 TaxID=212767 RepID=UPI0002A5A25C|nr:condensation domain-containing protein [Mycobacterium sp. JS623]AGB23773.1 non-ribosomal peptide synthase [Mycobacterium sp. JS623]